MFSAQFSASAWSFRICFLGELIITKPVLGEVRCVRLGWECMSGFVCLLFVFSSRGFELQSIIVLFLSGLFCCCCWSSKTVDTFAFQGWGQSYRDGRVLEMYYVPSQGVSGHRFFFINLKTKKGHLVKLYTVHQSMHKWQLVFLSHCLNFFLFL